MLTSDEMREIHFANTRSVPKLNQLPDAAEAKRRTEEGRKKKLADALNSLIDQLNLAINAGETSMLRSKPPLEVAEYLKGRGYHVNYDRDGDATISWGGND